MIDLELAAFARERRSWFACAGGCGRDVEYEGVCDDCGMREDRRRPEVSSLAAAVKEVGEMGLLLPGIRFGEGPAAKALGLHRTEQDKDTERVRRNFS